MCSNTRDIDFCRDKKILSHKWKCEECGTMYDKDFIEFSLIQKVKKILDYYFNQDLQCCKCRTQKSELAFAVCKCAGEFKETFSKVFFVEKSNIRNLNDFFSTLKIICNYYGMTKIKSYLSSIFDR